MIKPLLVGELNPYGSDAEFALFPLPTNASGGRLARILGLSRAQYLRTFDRVNLCTGRWELRSARVAAVHLKTERLGGIVVLLGRKVQDAFRLSGLAPFTAHARDGLVYAILPHPSGLCRLWKEPDSAERARRCVAAAGVVVEPPGVLVP